MICQDCNEEPATLHFTKIIDGEKTEVHLCEKCASNKGESFMFNTGAAFSMNTLLAGLLNIEENFPNPPEEVFRREEEIRCDRCSMTLQQFKRTGRFGCANCYEVFQGHLRPIFRRLHSGNWTHNGKVPKRIGGHIHVRKELGVLKQELKKLVEREEFEHAAKVRDEIRTIEQQLVENKEGEE